MKHVAQKHLHMCGIAGDVLGKKYLLLLTTDVVGKLLNLEAREMAARPLQIAILTA